MCISDIDLKKSLLVTGRDSGNFRSKKNSIPVKEWSFKRMATTYSPTIIAVPSALAVLTSLFGMGRGGTPPQ